METSSEAHALPLCYRLLVGFCVGGNANMHTYWLLDIFYDVKCSLQLSLQEQLPSYDEIHTVNLAYDCFSKNLTNHL